MTEFDKIGKYSNYVTVLLPHSVLINGVKVKNESDSCSINIFSFLSCQQIKDVTFGI